jgi:pyruvate, water dikinase
MNRIFNIIFLLLVVQFESFAASKAYSGTVIDTRSKLPIAGVAVTFSDTTIFTNTNGYFQYIDMNPTNTKIALSQIVEVEVFTLQGQRIGRFTSIESARLFMIDLPYSYYVLLLHDDLGNVQSLRWTPNTINKSLPQSTETQQTKSVLKSQIVDELAFSKTGYFDQHWPLRSDSTYEMVAMHYDSLFYFHSLISKDAFDLVKGLPLLPKQSQIGSVKLIYSLEKDSLYYVNSERFTFHYDFVTKVLGYTGSVNTFDYSQYTDSPNRIYILASLNHYESSNTWGLEFFPGDMVSCSLVEKMYNAVAASAYFGDSLKLVTNAKRFESCATVPLISQEEINGTQRYQALNLSEGYGYLKKVKASQMNSTYLSHHDIVLLDSVPLDISPVSGIITAEFQTPLCHVNILSHNRGTPNMAFRAAFTDPNITALENQLIYLKVEQDSFIIRTATIAEATAYWNAHDPSVPVNLTSDTTTVGLVDFASAGVNDLVRIGGKASNFAELSKVKCYYSELSSIPLPEGAFAIPFSYYAQHIKKNKIDSVINATLADPLFASNAAYQQTKLLYIQQLIKTAPIDTNLLKLVKDKIASFGSMYGYYRFRSSTNTEDVEDFNGAGLYDSYSGSLLDPNKAIDKAIKKVWASLWNFNAFEEREYYKIIHTSVQMAVLVHRSFPSEVANGVVISKIIYDRPDIQYPGVTINTQYGETSITNPDGMYTPEQIICYSFSLNPNTKYTIDYMGKSNMLGKENSTVLTDAEITLLTDISLEIQYHYMVLMNKNVTMDIEFKIDIVNGTRKLYIKQARTY